MVSSYVEDEVWGVGDIGLWGYLSLVFGVILDFYVCVCIFVLSGIWVAY